MYEVIQELVKRISQELGMKHPGDMFCCQTIFIIIDLKKNAETMMTATITILSTSFFFRLTVTHKDFLPIEKTNARKTKTQFPLLTLLEKM